MIAKYLAHNVVVDKNDPNDEIVLVISGDDGTESVLSRDFFQMAETVNGAVIQAIDSAISTGNAFLLALLNDDSGQHINVLNIDGEIRCFRDPDGEELFPIPDYFEIRLPDAVITRTGVYQYILKDAHGAVRISAAGKYSLLIPACPEEAGPSAHFETVAQACYPEGLFFITRYLARGKIRGDLMQVEVIESGNDVSCRFIDRNTLQIYLEGQSYNINFRRARNNILNLPINSSYSKNIVLRINTLKYVIWKDRRGWHMTTTSLGAPAYFRIISLFSCFILFGLAHKVVRHPVDVYLQDPEGYIPLGKVHRIGSFYFIRLPKEFLLQGSRIHSAVIFSYADRCYSRIKMKPVVTPLEVYSQGRAGKSEEIVLRASAGGALYRTLVPYAPEYSFIGRIRQALARRIAPRLMGRKTKPLVLYFEKKSDKADESAIHVFERVMERNIQTSTNEFIISSKSDAYPALKEKYGKAIVEKYSLHHYVSILLADYFVSSELSNHVISDRVYLNTFSEKIKETPLLFLQHGIMFAKPIDNPQAADFHKANLRVNLQKSVVCSELEAGEFYKVGYTPDDLIITGLATFDFAKLDPDADRIAYMPTYRYWEEHLVYSGHIEETSYYQDIKSVIETFIKAGLINRLLIVPHNKFSQYFADAFPDYEGLVDPNPSHALKKSVVFITDYSSAIYDAIIRGAYPIFYWKDRDYLIENYQAIPPVNEFNAPGPAAFSENELIEYVKKALERNCDLEPEYRAKYKAINKFDDGHNTDRIVDYLMENKII